MNPPRLIYLGPVDVQSAEELLLEGEPLALDAVVPLVRQRSPWKRFKGMERVILGGDERRADILLCGDGIHAEHIRFYIAVDGSPTDLRSLNPDSTLLNGIPVEALEWTYLHGGEEITVASWRFRYEVPMGGIDREDHEDKNREASS